MALKWALMTKEQKQIAGFAVFCVIGVLYMGYAFGIVPALEKTAETRTSLEEAEMELGKMRRAVKSERAQKDRIGTVNAELKEVSRELLPKVQDPLSWASELLGRVSREAGVTLTRVEERGVSRKNIESTHFRTYGVDVSIVCSYFDALDFVQILRKNNPYSIISEMSIRDGSEMEVHSIVIVIEWPIWHDDDIEMKLDL